MSAFVRKVVFPEFPTIPQVPVIVDNLENQDTNKTLSSRQGYVLDQKNTATNERIDNLDLLTLQEVLQNLPQGKIIKTGTSSGGNVVFNQSFNALDKVLITPIINQSTNFNQVTDFIFGILSEDENGFTYIARYRDANGDFLAYVNLQINWIAIGD